MGGQGVKKGQVRRVPSVGVRKVRSPRWRAVAKVSKGCAGSEAGTAGGQRKGATSGAGGSASVLRENKGLDRTEHS